MCKFIALAFGLIPLLANARPAGEEWMRNLVRVGDTEASLVQTIRLLGTPTRRQSLVTHGGEYAAPSQPKICRPLPAGVPLVVLWYRYPPKSHMEARFYYQAGKMVCHTWYAINARGELQDGP